MASKNTIIDWFKKGMIPTEDQFRQVWNSYHHKDEKLPQSAIEGLTLELDNKAEREALTIHETDPDAHAEQFAKVITPFKFLTFRPADTVPQIVVPDLIGCEIDAMLVQNQTFTDVIHLDTETGLLSGWQFESGIKHIILYTKL